MIAADDLDRRVLMDVTADGAVFLRERGSVEKGGAAGVPVFSTDSFEEAERIRRRHCRLARDGSGIYRLNEFCEEPLDLEYLHRVTDMFRETFAALRARAAQRGEGCPATAFTDVLIGHCDFCGDKGRSVVRCERPGTLAPSAICLACAGLALALGHQAATEWPGGIAVAAGFRGVAAAGHGQCATAGDGGVVAAGHGGEAHVGCAGIAVAGEGGAARAGTRAVAIAGYGGAVSAGEGGVIVRAWFDANARRRRLSVGYVGEDSIEPDKLYLVDEHGRFHEEPR